jgi:hypothetical protein
LAKDIPSRSDPLDIVPDPHFISASPCEDLSKGAEDGSWDRKKLSDAHILFLEPGEEHDYMQNPFTVQSKNTTWPPFPRHK